MKQIVKKILLSLMLFAAFSLTLPLGVKAISLSISPVGLYPEVLAGSHTEYTYVFRLDEFNEDMNIVITTDLKDFDKWVSFKPAKEFIYKAGQDKQDITIVVDVPETALGKLYSGFVRVNAKKIGPGQEAASVISGTRLDVNLRVSNNKLHELTATAAWMGSRIEVDKEILVNVNADNRGNIADAFERAELFITDLNGGPIITYEQTSFDLINPHSTKEIIVPFQNELKEGTYYATLKLYFQGQVVFSDRMLLTVEKKMEALPFTGDYLNEGFPFLLLFLIACTLIVLMLVLIFQRKKPSKRSTVIASVLVVPLFGLLAYLGMALTQYRSVNTIINDIKGVAPVINSENTGESGQQKLLGIITTNTPGNNLLSKTSSGSFKVFSKPDFSSEVIYQANENEKFTAVEDLNDWYKIELPVGGFGYLPKSSVIKSVSK